MIEIINKIKEEINNNISKLDQISLNFWKLIKIDLSFWEYNNDKKFNGKYCVIGIFGNHCIYYNHYENGFNISTFSKYGFIDNYTCNDYSFSEIINHLILYQLKDKLY